MDKKKPIGYTKEQTKSMKALIERTQEKAGDYVGSGTVTTVPKKKKKMKRMMDGGMTRAAPYGRGKGPMSDALSNAMPVRGGGGVPVQGRDGTRVKPPRPDGKGSESPGMPKKLDFGRGTNIQIGGGGRTPGIRGVSDAPGRINPDYARNRAGIPSIAQIESKPISGMRPDPVTGRLPTPVPKVDMTAPRQPGQKGYGMKGGGLARKGVGMALAKGGLVKANGCAQRGKSKGKMV